MVMKIDIKTILLSLTYALSSPNNCRAQSVQCTSNNVRDDHWMNIRCNVKNIGQTTKNNRPSIWVNIIFNTIIITRKIGNGTGSNLSHVFFEVRLLYELKLQ